MNPYSSQSILQLGRYFYRLPLCPPSFASLLHSSFSKLCQPSNPPDDGVPWDKGLGGQQAAEGQRTPLLLPWGVVKWSYPRSLAPDLWFFTSFVEAALLEVSFLLLWTIPLQETALVSWESGRSVSEPRNLEMQVSGTTPLYIWMTLGKPFKPLWPSVYSSMKEK